MKTMGNHIHAAVLRALAAEAGLDVTDRQKPILVIEEIRIVDWASATFIGARHEIDVRLEGPQPGTDNAVERLVQGIAERDIVIAGHIVAEIGVSLVEQSKAIVNLSVQSLTVNVLTIID